MPDSTTPDSLQPASPTPASPQKAVLALVLVNILWGSSFPIMKSLNMLVDDHFGVTQDTASTLLRASSAAWMIGLRFTIALGLFAIFFRSVMRRVRRIHVLAGIAIGSLFFAGLVLQVSGLSTIPASRSGFLTSLAVVWTPLLTTILHRRLPRSNVLVAAAISLVGVAILTGLVEIDGRSIHIAENGLAGWRTGDTLTLLSVLFFSAHIILVDTLGKRMDSLALTPGMFATTAVLSGLFFAATHTYVPEKMVSDSTWTELLIEPGYVGLIGFLAVFPSLLAFSMMNRFQPSVSASQAAVVYTLEPLFASAWAMFVPGILCTFCLVQYANETMTSELAIGGAVLIAANILAMWPRKVR